MQKYKINSRLVATENLVVRKTLLNDILVRILNAC